MVEIKGVWFPLKPHKVIHFLQRGRCGNQVVCCFWCQLEAHLRESPDFAGLQVCVLLFPFQGKCQPKRGRGSRFEEGGFTCEQETSVGGVSFIATKNVYCKTPMLGWWVVEARYPFRFQSQVRSSGHVQAVDMAESACYKESEPLPIPLPEMQALPLLPLSLSRRSNLRLIGFWREDALRENVGRIRKLDKV